MILKGRSDCIATEEVKSIIFATECILRSHGYSPPDDYRVLFRKVVSKREPTTMGHCIYPRLIVLKKSLNFNDTLTTVIHEMIHLCVWPKEEVEKEEYLTSTLTSKIKEDVLLIANTLAKGKYKRAAFFAHLKIAYPKQTQEDKYNPDEDKDLSIPSEGKKYRG